MKPWAPARAAWRSLLEGEPARVPALAPPWTALEALPPLLSQWVPWTRGQPAAVERALSLVEEHLSELQELLVLHPDSPARGDLALAVTSEDTLLVLGLLPQSERAGLSHVDTPAQAITCLERGRRLLERRTLDWEQQTITRELPRLLERVDRELQGLGRLGDALQLGLGQLGRGADRSVGSWQQAGWEGLEAAARVMGSSTSLAEYVRQIGRRQGASAVSRPGPAPIAAPPSEIRGISLGRDLDRVLSSELGLLADPELEWVFAERLLSGRLLQLDVDPAMQRAEDAGRVPIGTHAGPILLLLDTSGSMRGEPEQLAKALTLAMLKEALLAGRACHLVAFGSDRQLQVAELSALPAGLPKLLELLSGRFAGGTDPSLALERALQWEEPRADLLMVTDGAFVARTELLKQIEAAQQARGLRCHMLVVGEGQHAGTHRGWAQCSRWVGSLSQGEVVDAG